MVEAGPCAYTLRLERGQFLSSRKLEFIGEYTSQEVTMVQNHQSHPLWMLLTFHFLILSSLGSYGFSSISQHYSLASTIPHSLYPSLPLWPFSLCLLSRLLLLILCPISKYWDAPRLQPISPLCRVIKSLTLNIIHVMMITNEFFPPLTSLLVYRIVYLMTSLTSHLG